MSVRKFGGVEVKNTSALINRDSKFCVMLYAPPKFGKTTMLATLDKMTKTFHGKPTLVIALEAADGGGTMSIREAGIDYITPSTKEELERIVAELATDKYYGGVGLDSSYEYVSRFLKPYALKFPSRERSATRDAGVPERSDYQTMGEESRKFFNRLIGLTTAKDIECRKHLVVTALEKEKTDGSTGALLAIQPDLPGAMAGSSTAMFQTVGNIKIKATVGKDENGKPTRTYTRVFSTEGDGVRVCGDRTHLFPPEVVPDFELIYGTHWIPAIQKLEAESGAEQTA